MLPELSRCPILISINAKAPSKNKGESSKTKKHITDKCPKTQDNHTITIDYKPVPTLNTASPEYKKLSFSCEFSKKCSCVNNCPVFKNAPIYTTE